MHAGMRVRVCLHMHARAWLCAEVAQGRMDASHLAVVNISQGMPCWKVRSGDNHKGRRKSRTWAALNPTLAMHSGSPL